MKYCEALKYQAFITVGVLPTLPVEAYLGRRSGRSSRVANCYVASLFRFSAIYGGFPELQNSKRFIVR